MSAARRPLPVLASAVAVVLALTGCAAGTPAPDDGRIRVVTVTDVYGDIVQQIGGDRVRVTSIVTGTAVDPHEYEASTRDQLTIAEADLVIMNGGGLDDFMTRLVDAAGTDATVITAVDASGLLGGDHAAADDHGHLDGFNEHVWYSIQGMEHVAEAIQAALLELDPAGAATIRAGATGLLDGLAALDERAHSVAAELGGGDVIATEPVTGYLLADLGLTDVTPTAFLAAVEEGTGVGVALLDEILTLFGGHGIRLLAENVQSGGAEAAQVRAAAIAAGVPVVAFSETLPSGEDYLSWMTANVDAVAAALR